MICKNCNTENVENAVFCGNCGARLAEETPAPAPAPAPTPAPAPAPAPAPTPTPAPVVNKIKIPAEYKPVSAWGYFWLNILYSIPVVGFIFLLIHTFNGSNLNRRNYARSFWCALLVALIIVVIAAAVVIVVAAVSGVAFSEIVDSYYY